MDIDSVKASEIYGLYQPQRLKAIVKKQLDENSATQFQPNDVERYNQSIINKTNSVSVETYSPNSNNPIGNTKGNTLDTYA